MPSTYQKDIQLAFVGKTPVAKTTGAISTLNDGEIGLFTPAGTRLTEASAATATQFIIVQGRGSSNPPIVSGIINKADITRANRKAYVAPTEQLDYIGYNGSSGSLDVINDNLYYVRLHLNQFLSGNHGGLYIKNGVYQSPVTGTTQETIAAGLHQSLVNNFLREPERQIRFERVCSNAGAANTITAGADATHYTFTYGSKFVVGTDSAGLAMRGSDEVVATTVAGDYLRVGTAVTDPVYKIVAVTDGTGTTPAGTPMIIELDVPYQGTTTSIAIGSTEYITAALAAVADFGIKLIGQELKFQLPNIHYKKCSWTTTLEKFGTTTVTKSTTASRGTGAYEDMAEVEWFTQGNEGEFYRTPAPYVIAPRAVVSDQGYDQIDLEVVSTDHKSSLISTTAPKLYTLIIPNTTPAFADGGTADDITDVLEVLVYGSATGALAL